MESFEECLGNLERVLIRSHETNLALSHKKCYYIVIKGIVLGHKVSKQGFEVDRAKILIIEGLPLPVLVAAIRSFLGHARFYRMFIKDFSKIARSLTRLVEKDVPFKFSKEYM